RRGTAQVQFLGEIEALQRERQLAMFEAERAVDQEQFAIRQEDLFLNRDERMELIDEMEQAELEALEEAAEIKGLTEFEAEQQRLNVQRAFAKQRRDVANKELQQRVAFFNAMIQAGAQAAAQELSSTRNVSRALRAIAAEQVRAAAQSASRQIAIKGAEATAKSFANAGGFPLGVAAAAATAAFYALLAGTVSAGGAAIANRLRPPAVSDQAEIAAPSTISVPTLAAEERQKATTGRARAAVERRAATRTALAGGAAAAGVAPGAEGAGDRVTIVIQSLTGEIDQPTLEKLEKALNKSKRGRG
ncbi:MAG: hypothetical protein KAU28_06620, partial [Phycisphaerae bacterium]|nr:hypothetical protein [Phycisphaerae bacterium]